MDPSGAAWSEARSGGVVAERGGISRATSSPSSPSLGQIVVRVEVARVALLALGAGAAWQRCGVFVAQAGADPSEPSVAAVLRLLSLDAGVALGPGRDPIVDRRALDAGILDLRRFRPACGW